MKSMSILVPTITFSPNFFITKQTKFNNKMLNRLFLRNTPRTPFGLTYFSTATATATATTTAESSSEYEREGVVKKDTLFGRLSHLGTPDISIIPVLDKWADENKSLNLSNLRYVVSQLRYRRRYTHALQASQWMGEKKSTLVSAADIAIRLDLIAKLHGVEEAENFFNNVSKEFRTLEVYTALLNCFAHAKCVDKAEGVMETMRDLGFARCPLPYNVMVNLYGHTGNRVKLDAMLNEMEANKIKFDSLTYSFVLKAYGSDIDGIQKIVTKMESDPEVSIEWKTYEVAANQFLRAQLVDKALELIRKSENLVGFSKKKSEAYASIINFYANARKKEDVLRVWEFCKLCKATNRDYISFMPSILKLSDMEIAEKIFDDWRNSNLLKDIRIPNFLIAGYCRNGMVEKAEALLKTITSEKWQTPDSFTWYWMSYVYVNSNQMPKAVKAVELALLGLKPQVCFKRRQEALAACIKYLKDEGDLERLNAFIESLKDKSAISAKTHEKLIGYVSGQCDIEDVFQENELEDNLNQVGIQEAY